MERFWSKTKPTEDGCLTWTGSTDNKNYGHYWYGGKTLRAHRYLFEETYGPIPEGMQIDHICKNHSCVKLEHIRLVSLKQNVLFGRGPTAINSQKIECINGHPFTKENTINRRDQGKNHRVCRECYRKTVRKYRIRKRMLLADEPRASRMPPHLPSVDPIFLDAVFNEFTPDKKALLEKEITA